MGLHEVAFLEPGFQASRIADSFSGGRVFGLSHSISPAGERYR